MADNQPQTATSSSTKAAKVSKWTPKEDFPAPLVTDPQLEHKQTFIILHGRGSTAERYSAPLLATQTPSNETIQTAFPHAKLVFLTASRNRAVIYGRKYTHQWFDNWHHDRFHERHDMVVDGLRKSCIYVHGIIQQEIDLIGAQNVVLWGMSQGSATSIASLLTWDGKPFAATVGMCGYLPFANLMKEIASEADLDGDDPFARSNDEDGEGDIFDNDGSAKKDTAREAVDFLRVELDMEDKTGMVFQKVPVFLGHGTEDEKVSIAFGREVKDCLELCGADVRMVEYGGLDHWYSPAMLGDIFAFLRESLKVT